MRHGTIHWNQFLRFFALGLCVLVFVTGCMRFSKQRPGEQPDLSQPRQSFYSAPFDRANSGFVNIVTGPFELIYQLKEETKRTNYLVGFVPGMVRGVTWFALREVVGVFEIATFWLPLKPHLEPFDFTWLAA